VSNHTIRTVSNRFNANSLNLISTGGLERTKNISRFSLIGMGTGVGCALLTRGSIMLGLLLGTLGGMTIGTLIENAKK